MKKSTKNNGNTNFLKEEVYISVSKHHQEYLGTEIPEGYFTKSKASILDTIKEEQKAIVLPTPKKQKVFWLKPSVKYAVAASVALVIGMSVWFKNENTFNVQQTDTGFLAIEDDVLINSLLVEDTELDLFADATLVNEIVIKAELSEQKMDDLLINSLFIEDSLIDVYTDEEFIETIIL